MVIEKAYSDSFNQLFSLIYKENKEATELSNKLIEISQTWDDLVDKDKSVSASMVNNAFRGAMFEVQNNPLWFNCGLNHHVLNCYLRWRDATNIENSADKTTNDLHKCYMLRAGLYDLFAIMAYFLHGDEWAETVGPIIRKHYGETLSDYLEEFGNA